MALWSYSCGRKGVSRVRVYERSNARGLYVEWYYDAERFQRSLKTVAGHPVTDRKLAMDIAHDMSAKLEQDANRAARHAVFGYQSGKSLASLFDALHTVRSPTWSKSHAKDQERFKRYWLETLKKAAVELHKDHAVLKFPAETDKARNSGEVPVTGRAFELTRDLMETPGAYVLGRRPPRKELCIKGWLAKAEEAAKIPHKAGRGFHGLKRRYALETKGMVGRDKQSGTTDQTLDGRYVPDDMDPKRTVAEHMAGLVENA